MDGTRGTSKRQQRRDRALRRLMARTQVVLTEHARERCAELGFSEVEVHEVLVDHEQSYCSHPAFGRHCRTFQQRDLAVVVDEHRREVVTVLLRTSERWEHGVHTRRDLPVSA